MKIGQVKYKLHSANTNQNKGEAIPISDNIDSKEGNVHEDEGVYFIMTKG